MECAQVIPYTTLEYVRGARSYDNRQEVSAQGPETPGELDGLDVYLGKTYNRIDARRYRTDAIVVIPSYAKGDASLASPCENGIEEAQGSRGGFVANCELCLRSGVYTAGDAASVLHPILGEKVVGGEYCTRALLCVVSRVCKGALVYCCLDRWSAVLGHSTALPCLFTKIPCGRGQ